MNYGWICPKCGNVYAPLITICCKCNKDAYTLTSTSSAKIDYEKWKDTQTYYGKNDIK